MPPQAEPKKRPPPITIPLPYKPRAIPGPNAFAVTTNAKQDGPNRNKDERRSANDTPVSSPLEDVILPAPGSQHSRKDGSSRGSAMTAVMEFARGSSPRKSDGLSSTNNRHGPAPMSSTKSRYSHRSHRSATSSRPGTAGQKSTGEEEDHATVRSQIESRAEKKLFKMMGQIPGSPAADNEDIAIVRVTRYSDALKSQEIAEKKPEEPIKSPKKKLFGMSIPFSRSSTPSAPPMPSKAAQVLGTDTGIASSNSPPSRRRNPSRHVKYTPRSDTSKSLPGKVLDNHGYSRRPNQHGSPRARSRTPSHRPQTAGKVVQGNGPEGLSGVLGSSSSLGNPPTPPKKDTPRETRVKTNVEDTQGPINEALSRIPNFFTPAKPVPSSGGQSPTKFCPYTAEDYAQLIEPHPVLSAHGQVGRTQPEDIVSELEGDTEYPNSNGFAAAQKEEPQWHDKLQKKWTSNELNGSGMLKPAFYSSETFDMSLFEGGRPSHNAQADQHHWLFTVPPQPSTDSMRSNPTAASIQIMFQGTPSEIGPASDVAPAVDTATPTHMSAPKESNDPDLKARVMRELRVSEQPETAERAEASMEPSSQHLQPDQSSSRLTDILSGVSPSRASYNNNSFYANCPSAVPSPLRGPPGPQGGPQTIYYPEPVPLSHHHSGPGNLLTGGSRSGDPFESIHGHLAADAQWFYDTIENSKRETLRESIEKHNDLQSLLEKHFDGIKADIHSIEQKADRAAEQSHAINTKLDRTFELIKNELIEPQASQNKRIAELESSVKDMHKAMQSLARSFESKMSQPTANGHVPQAGPASFSQLPHHRSQPSLVDVYSSTTHDPGRGLTTIPEARPGGTRFGYTYGHNNNNGQWWNNRPSANGREGDENVSYVTSSGNAYPNTPLPQYGSSYGLYPGGPTDHSYGYTQGGSK